MIIIGKVVFINGGKNAPNDVIAYYTRKLIIIYKLLKLQNRIIVQIN